MTPTERAFLKEFTKPQACPSCVTLTAQNVNLKEILRRQVGVIETLQVQRDALEQELSAYVSTINDLFEGWLHDKIISDVKLRLAAMQQGKEVACITKNK